MPEITEQEYLRLRRLDQFAGSLLNNEESARLVEQAAKIVNPNIKTPRLDRAAAATAPLAAISESIEKLSKRMDEEATARANQAAVDAANAKRTEGISALRKQGWNDAGIEQIEKIMTEKGIADPLDAAVVFERRYPPPTPAMPGSNGTFNFNETLNSANPDEDIKKLLKTRGRDSEGLEAVSNKMIADTLQQVRSGQG